MEEKEHLSNVLNVISSKIRLLYANMPYPEVSKYAVGHDRDEISDLQYGKRRNEKTKVEIESLSKFTDSPYFARMDFEDSDSTGSIESLYIGKDSLMIDNKQYVYDWRSPVGQRYYLKNVVQFSHNNYIYNLLLRRALDVNKGNLIGYDDEYAVDNKEIHKDISDPFLVKLLKEKRSQYALSDIIRTIQNNQNDIIILDPSINFIVQGCAGSGKTMIMLHRLSYLKFNHPSLSLNRIKILTPNRNFNLHINDLSKNLELDLIEKYTVEDYYYSILKKYDPINWGAEKSILMDLVLDQEFIRNIYSEKFQTNCIKYFYEYSNNIISELEIDKVNSICKNHELDFFVNQSNSLSRKLENYKEFISRVMSNNSISKIKVEKERTDLKNMKEYLDHLLKLSDLKGENEVKKRRLQDNIDDKYYQIANLFNSEAMKSIFKKTGIEFKSNTKYSIDYISNIFSNVELIDSSKLINGSELLKKISKLEDDIKEKRVLFSNIIKSFNALRKANNIKLTDLEASLSNISFFSFLKRTKISTEITSLKENIQSSEEAYSSSISDLLELESDLKIFEIQYSNIKETLITNKDYLEIEHIKKILADLYQSINTLEEKINSLDGINIDTSNIEKQESKIMEQNKTIDIYENKLFTEEEIVILENKLSLLNKLTTTYIFKNTIGLKLYELIDLYKINDISGIYRFNIYINLLFYSQYYGRVNNYDTYLNIDEGQDLSVSEYKLLRLVNGASTVFNIYGDNNQLINENGIRDWNQLNEISKLFYLNENYRNTIEITKFCNDKLNINSIPIGISGNNIELVEIQNLLKRLQELRSKNVEKRIAIIVTRQDTTLIKDCIERGCVAGKMNSGKVSVLTVEESKGLEFDLVFVFSKNMSRNQKYISYTRALDELVLVS